MRQRPSPPAHGGGNLCGKTLPRSRTATPGSQRKYEQLVRGNRPSALLGDTYVDRSPSVSPHRDQQGTPIMRVTRRDVTLAPPTTSQSVRTSNSSTIYSS